VTEFEAIIYGKSCNPVKRRGDHNSGVQARLAGKTGFAIAALQMDADGVERLTITHHLPGIGGSRYIYRGALAPDSGPDIDRILAIARSSDNDSVRIALENLLMVTKMAHSEELAE
jgi:hypothetical protein